MSSSLYNQAINNLITSIALEETSLSQVIHSQAEKLETIINNQGITENDLQDVEACLHLMNQAIFKLETILRAKIEFFDSQVSPL